MCLKLRTVTASNNRDHALQSLHYCLFAPHICGVFLRAHPVRGESHIQRKANGEVATSCIITTNIQKTLESTNARLYVATRYKISQPKVQP